jgi:1-acyl-sn-glycerol-3-phosphate acyltransferase
MRSFLRWFLNNAIRFGTGIICRINKHNFSSVPSNGPLILVGNHIGSLEVPLLFVHLQPRKIIGLAKIETWDSKFMGWLFDLWNAIPVRRGEADLDAIRACLDVLKAGNILAISPEGTRSYDGQLLSGQPGIALLALRSGAPILPIAHWGAENFGANLKKLKRTDFNFRVGTPFYLDSKGEKVNGEIRKAMADEIMVQIAALLPEKYRGEYANWNSPPKYLRFSE